MRHYFDGCARSCDYLLDELGTTKRLVAVVVAAVPVVIAAVLISAAGIGRLRHRAVGRSHGERPALFVPVPFRILFVPRFIVAVRAVVTVTAIVVFGSSRPLGAAAGAGPPIDPAPTGAERTGGVGVVERLNKIAGQDGLIDDCERLVDYDRIGFCVSAWCDNDDVSIPRFGNSWKKKNNNVYLKNYLVSYFCFCE